MTSSSLLIISGVCFTFATFVLSNQPRIFVPGNDFYQCRRAVRERGRNTSECVSKEFTAEKMNETSLMFEDTKCVQCKHICRKVGHLVNCTREATEMLKDFTIKSRRMVPFAGQLIEEGIYSLCENDAEIMTVYENEDNRHCISASWDACRDRLDNVDDITRSAICEAEIPENDPNTKQYICQKIMDLLECAEKDVEPCSTDVKNAANILMSKLRNTKSCGKYF